MSLFERFRAKKTDVSPEQAALLEAAAERVQQAHASVNIAERRRGYERARLAEVLPDIKEKTSIELDEQHAQLKLTRIRNRLAVQREMLGLIRQREARRPSDIGAKEERETAQEVGRLEAEERAIAQEHEAILFRLSEITARIAEAERNLRQRFGLSDQA